ncbi:MAG: L-glutamate gamma-semialdehyde dehydrogenase [Calditrichaeota bacterium]|nr:MAG: L-glutamate gamma-semialdehyde dehydrogenase [Calditrichota bacterium]
MVGKFRNEPVLDFSIPENKKKMEDALAYVKSQFTREYPLRINGEDVKSGNLFKSCNPANKDEVVGTFHRAGKKEVDMAMDAALTAFEDWKYFDPEERGILLIKAANIMRRRRFELNAWMVYETSKNWVEADADTAEAIDFLDFYGREMLRLNERQPLTDTAGEFNKMIYIPLGVGAVIPPWNFPNAILVGMTSAAIVTGNTVLLKPSSDSPCTGYCMMEIMEEAGIPKGVLNFVPGSGSEIGDYIVQHHKTRFIAFTGSMEVGLRINRLAAATSEGQIWIKRVVAEMGGKDGIVVDSEADVEAAASATVASAFGFQGQKCSACSRVMVDESIYDKFCDLIVEKTNKLTIGDTTDPSNYMGAVINKASFDSISKYIEIGKKEGMLIAGGEGDDSEGYYIKPTIIKDIAPDAVIAQEEIFGPVLAVIKVKGMDEAMQVANNTIYGLTGAFFSRNKAKTARAKQEFHVGNLYINRKCTGALVDVHPFGGFNMSGTDSKAGGRDYLQLFLQAKTISEQL